MFSRKTYRGKNMFFNDTPYPYLEIYSQGLLTLSNRIHACVAALSYGKPAMLFSSSPRVRMLERLGLQDIIQHPVYLESHLLDREKRNLRMFLQEHLAKL
jgi:polysaccharide pyruvyl transferase WcaK-like protein